MLLLNIDKLRCSSVHGYLSQGRQRIRRSNFWKGIYLEERGLYNLLKTDVTIEQEFQIYSSKINTYWLPVLHRWVDWLMFTNKICIYKSISTDQVTLTPFPAHLLQYGTGAGPERIVWQEQQQCRTFSQLTFQEAGLCSWRLQPVEDGLVVFKHPATDGLWCEVALTSREDLTEENNPSPWVYTLNYSQNLLLFSLLTFTYQRGIRSSVKVHCFIVLQRDGLGYLFVGHNPETYSTAEICTRKTEKTENIWTS